MTHNNVVDFKTHRDIPSTGVIKDPKGYTVERLFSANMILADRNADLAKENERLKTAMGILANSKDREIVALRSLTKTLEDSNQALMKVERKRIKFMGEQAEYTKGIRTELDEMIKTVKETYGEDFKT